MYLNNLNILPPPVYINLKISRILGFCSFIIILLGDMWYLLSSDSTFLPGVLILVSDQLVFFLNLLVLLVSPLHGILSTASSSVFLSSLFSTCILSFTFLVHLALFSVYPYQSLMRDNLIKSALLVFSHIRLSRSIPGMTASLERLATAREETAAIFERLAAKERNRVRFAKEE